MSFMSEDQLHSWDLTVGKTPDNRRYVLFTPWLRNVANRIENCNRVDHIAGLTARSLIGRNGTGHHPFPFLPLRMSGRNSSRFNGIISLIYMF
jgi:hypothetical protein